VAGVEALLVSSEVEVGPFKVPGTEAMGDNVMDDRAEAYTWDKADGFASSGENGLAMGIAEWVVTSGDAGGARRSSCELVTSKVECGPCIFFTLDRISWALAGFSRSDTRRTKAGTSCSSHSHVEILSRPADVVDHHMEFH
jgi:hypothetical protein